MSPDQLTLNAVKTLLVNSIDTLGKGANGSVVLVRHEGQMCALKIAMRESQLASFEKERYIMQILAGAGGAPLPLAFCPEVPALLMSLRHGMTLSNLLQADKLGFSDWDWLNIAFMLSTALQEVHQAGVVHSDLKKDNIIVELTESGYPVGVSIIDFGLAVMVGGSHTPRTPNSRKRWYCDCFYIGCAMGPACDMPGLGVILEQLCTRLTHLPLYLENLVSWMTLADHRQRPELNDLLAYLEGDLYEDEEDYNQQEDYDECDEHEEESDLVGEYFATVHC
ncbi:serine/threonine-protein kinase Pkn1-like [Penaeus monodon]|uniref:serine/threonine-protein kinase Pkn1-like n=1 Tax=Penaeus monodon TaxID=6687 RepID=UPI0018A76D95|nr:serine/threonine-protein kinase Pkn1-like [Penaeus monodon]